MTAKTAMLRPAILRRATLGVLACALGCGADLSTRTTHDPRHTRLWFAADSTVNGWWGIPGLTPQLVIVGHKNGLIAFRRSDGAVAWRAQLWSNGYLAGGANVAVEDSTACLGDMDVAGCVDARTGRVLWQVSVPPAANPTQSVLDHGVWYYGTEAHEVIAVDARTGAEHWRRNLIPNAKFASVIWGISKAGDTLYAATREMRAMAGVPSAGVIVAMSAGDGAPIWRYETPEQRGGFMGAPVVTDSFVIGNDVDAHVLRAIRRRNGTQAWKSHVGPDGYITAERPPIVIGDTVYSASDDTQMHAVDLMTGGTLWQTVVSGSALQYTAACGGYLFTTDFAGGPLYAVSRATQDVFVVQVLQPDDHVRSRFAVDGGVVYFASRQGVYAERCA